MKFDLNKLIRDNIKTLKPYSSAREEFFTNIGVFLDANENPFGVYNRYPDPYQKLLKNEISKLRKIDPQQIFLGNGSDEIIDILIKIFSEPKQDKILIFTPTYGMYEVYANISNVEVVSFPLNQNFQIDCTPILEKNLNDENLKIIFICSPNNPTGNIIAEDSIFEILNNFNGIVVIDEAYQDFSEKESWISQIQNYPQLVVMQTLSKAWGLAGLRVGMAFAHNDIILYMNKVKPPYNISILNQKEALQSLQNKEIFKLQINKIKEQRNFLKEELKRFSFIKKIYPSDTNFLLLEVENADQLYQYLVSEKLIIRNRNNVIKNCVRITVGNFLENKKLLETLNRFK